MTIDSAPYSELNINNQDLYTHDDESPQKLSWGGGASPIKPHPHKEKKHMEIIFRGGGRLLLQSLYIYQILLLMSITFYN